MYKYLILSFFLILFSRVEAQVGISVGYGEIKNPDWEALPPNCDCVYIERNYRTIALDYRLRLKQKRLEFFPSIQWTTSDDFGFSGDIGNARWDYRVRSLRLLLNTRAYLLDFGSDCDCPTWSNSNRFFKKGFFVFVTPEIGSRDHIHLQGDEEVSSNRSLLFGVSGGLGLDIGLTDLFTLSPTFRLGYLSPSEWQNFDSSGALADETLFYGAELRLGVNF